MAHWNYRVMSHRQGVDTWLNFHEIHYDDAGKLEGYSPPGYIQAYEFGELEWALDRMREALAKPVLTKADFED